MKHSLKQIRISLKIRSSFGKNSFLSLFLSLLGLTSLLFSSYSASAACSLQSEVFSNEENKIHALILKTETSGDFHIPLLKLEPSKNRPVYSSVALKNKYARFTVSTHAESDRIYKQIKKLYELNNAAELWSIKNHPRIKVGVKFRTALGESSTKARQPFYRKLNLKDTFGLPFSTKDGFEFNGLFIYLDFSSICGEDFRQIPVETEVPLYPLQKAAHEPADGRDYGAMGDPHEGYKLSNFRFFLRLTHDLVNNNGNIEKRREQSPGLKDADRSHLLIGVRFEPKSLFGQDVVLPEIGTYLKTGNVTPVLHEARNNPGNAEKHYAAGIKVKTPLKGLRLHASTGRTSVSRPNDNRDGYYLFFSVGASYEIRDLGYVQLELQPGPLKDHRQEGLSPTLAVVRARVGPISLFTQVTTRGKHENEDYGYFVSPRLTVYPFRRGFFRYFFLSGGWRHEPYPYPLEGPTPNPRDVHDLNVFFISLGLGHSGYALDR